MKYGYIRVSSKSQKDNYSIKEQRDLVLAAGADEVIEEVYTGGKVYDRPKFDNLGELLGRVATMCNTQPMTKEHCFDIVRHSKSRLTVIADMLQAYGIDAWENLSDEIILQIIEDSEFDKYGVRGVLSKIESIMLLHLQVALHGFHNFLLDISS